MTVDFLFDFLSELFADLVGSGSVLIISMLIPCLMLFGFITIYALIVIYAELKISSFIQDKVGPMGQGVGLHAGKWGLLQPIADALKLLLKEDIIPSRADKPLFILAPFMIFIGAFISFVALPFGESIIVADLNIGLFYILGVGSIAVLSLILAGWSSNNKWSLYGGMRSAALIVSYEIPAGLSLIVVIMLAGTLNMQDIIRYQAGGIFSWIFFDNPFHNKNQIYEKKFIFHTSEERLIQCAVLKNKTNEMIWKNLEQRTRRSIRKSEKNDIKILIENINQIHMKKFYQLHVNTMKMKDGKYKPKNFFPAILKNFEPEKEYDIFIAMMGDKPIAYLLVFYYKNFAEYYLPAYDPEFLSLQATSHLIWESMKKAQNKKIDYYNFGGTWKNQEELYRFKRGWAANDFNYKYFIFRDLDRIKEAGLKEILKKYEYFYVCPFNDIK